MGALMDRMSFLWGGRNSKESNSGDKQQPNNQFVKEVIKALEQGDLQRLELLHENNELMLWGGLECLHTKPPLIQRAAALGYEEIIRYLIELGVDVDETDTCGMSALHEACKRRHHGCVKILVDKSNAIDRRDVWGRTPLIKALVYRNTKAAALLLEKGANPNAVDIYGMTPLSTAIDYNLVDILRVLVRHGADLNLITQHMCKCSGPPLYQAINNQNIDLVSELLRLGARTQPRSQDYANSFRGGLAPRPWQYLSNGGSHESILPYLQHANAVVMAMAELVRRGRDNIDTSGQDMEILMTLLAAHGHALGSSPEVLIRVLINSSTDDFSMLLHKLHVCSSSSQDKLLSSATGRESNERSVVGRPQHLQQMDHHLKAGEKAQPKAVMSLQNQARRVARRAVMASGRNVIWASKRLQCPPALKSLLVLRDIDRAYSPPALNKIFQVRLAQ